MARKTIPPHADPAGDMVCLYMNGWLLEGYDDAKAALLSSVLTQMSQHRRVGPKVKDTVKRLLNSVDWMRLLRYGVAGVALPLLVNAGLEHVGIPSEALAISATGSVGLQVLRPAESVETSESAGRRLEHAIQGGIDLDKLLREGTFESKIADIRTFRSNFAKMLKDTDIGTLVILIDDLDRCSPDRIIDNLEAIKLFLSVERTACVIGADPRIIQHAIAHRYGYSALLGQNDSAVGYDENVVVDYLEKLIQIPYRLPKLSPVEAETYMSLLFCAKDLDRVQLNQCMLACETHRKKNRYSPFGYAAIQDAIGANALPPALSTDLMFCAAVAPIITEGLKGNPRQIKRFLNAFMLRRRLAKAAGIDHIRDDVLAKLMVLEYVHMHQFHQLFDWQASQDGYPEQIASLEAACRTSEGVTDLVTGVDPMWRTPWFQRWMRLEPALSDVDLRDYFWIARDRLESTVSTSSMVPPAVRRIADGLLSGNDGQLHMAIKSVVELSPEEQQCLLEVVAGHIARTPTEIRGYDLLRRLVETDLPGSAQSLASAMSDCPPDKLPPALGVMLASLLKSKPSLEGVLGPVLQELKSSGSRTGRAARSVESLRNGGLCDGNV